MAENIICRCPLCVGVATPVMAPPTPAPWACPCCGDATAESPPVLDAAQRTCSRCEMSWTVQGWWTSAGARLAGGGDARAVCRRACPWTPRRPEPTPPPSTGWKRESLAGGEYRLDPSLARWGEAPYLDRSAGPWRPGTWRPLPGIAIADAQRGRPDHRSARAMSAGSARARTRAIRRAGDVVAVPAVSAAQAPGRARVGSLPWTVVAGNVDAPFRSSGSGRAACRAPATPVLPADGLALPDADGNRRGNDPPSQVTPIQLPR